MTKKRDTKAEDNITKGITAALMLGVGIASAVDRKYASPGSIPARGSGRQRNYAEEQARQCEYRCRYSSGDRDWIPEKYREDLAISDVLLNTFIVCKTDEGLIKDGYMPAYHNSTYSNWNINTYKPFQCFIDSHEKYRKDLETMPPDFQRKWCVSEENYQKLLTDYMAKKQSALNEGDGIEHSIAFANEQIDNKAVARDFRKWQKSNDLANTGIFKRACNWLADLFFDGTLALLFGYYVTPHRPILALKLRLLGWFLAIGLLIGLDALLTGNFEVGVPLALISGGLLLFFSFIMQD